MAWVPYDDYKLRQHNGNATNFDSGGNALKIVLLKSTYVPDRANHQTYTAHLASHEVSGTGYTPGGLLIDNQSVSIASNTLTFDCDDETIPQSASGFSDARFAVLINADTDRVLFYYDLGSDKGNVNGDLVLQTPSGIFTV